MENQSKGEIIMYRTEDGLTEIQTTLVDDTVWLTANQMAELFDKDETTIGQMGDNGVDIIGIALHYFGSETESDDQREGC